MIFNSADLCETFRINSKFSAPRTSIRRTIDDKSAAIYGNSIKGLHPRNLRHLTLAYWPRRARILCKRFSRPYMQLYILIICRLEVKVMFTSARVMVTVKVRVSRLSC